MKNHSPVVLVPKQLQIRRYTTPVPLHYHRMWELAIFESGNYINIIDGEKYDVSPGDVFLIGQPHLHAMEFVSGPNAYWDLYISNEEMQKICALIDGNFYEDIYSKKILVHFKLSETRLHHVLHDLREVSNYELSVSTTQKKENASKHAISSFLVHYLLGFYFTRQHKKNLSIPEWLQNLLYNLQSPEYFCQKAATIIENSGYSHAQFSREFKKYTSLTLIDYLTEKRLEYATELLQKTDLSVLDIAFNVGYTSLSFFIRIFKERYGVPPLQYRLNQKKAAKNAIQPL